MLAIPRVPERLLTDFDRISTLSRMMWCFGFFALILLLPTTLRAQEGPSDLTGLSLEELMDMNIIPVNAASSHIHSKDEWMAGYRYQATSMASAKEDDADSGKDHAMDMQMHMASAMYGVTNRLTLVAMLPYRHMSMESSSGSGSSMAMSGHGIGDLQLEAHYAVLRSSSHYLIANAGVSLPTGSIDLRADRPSRPKLPYSMQPGSGTLGLRPGVSFIHQRQKWTVGLHADATLQMGRNADDYRLGPRYHGGGWLNWSVRPWFAPLLHIDAHWKGAVQEAASKQGHTARLADPNKQASQHLSLSPGVILYIPNGPLEGQRLVAKVPVLRYEVSHRSLERALQVRVAWQWSF